MHTCIHTCIHTYAIMTLPLSELYNPATAPMIRICGGRTLPVCSVSMDNALAINLRLLFGWGGEGRGFSSPLKRHVRISLYLQMLSYLHGLERTMQRLRTGRHAVEKNAPLYSQLSATTWSLKMRVTGGLTSSLFSWPINAVAVAFGLTQGRTALKSRILL